MTLTKLHRDVLALLALHRSSSDFAADWLPREVTGAHRSDHLSVFQDFRLRLESAVLQDERRLRESGYEVSWTQILAGKREAEISRTGQRVRLSWVHDSSFRFFPALKDEHFGYVLSPADLAMIKVFAAADCRSAQDVVDLLLVHDHVLPLGAAVSASAGRFPDQTPEEMLANIRRHSRFSADEYQRLAIEHPLTVERLHCQIRQMLESAEEFISRIPSDFVGVLFLENGQPVEPDLADLGQYELRPGSLGRVWPTSPEIWRAMYEHYRYKES